MKVQKRGDNGTKDKMGVEKSLVWQSKARKKEITMPGYSDIEG